MLPAFVENESPEYRIAPPISPVSMLTASFPTAVPEGGGIRLVGVGIDVVIATSRAAVPTGVGVGGTGPPPPSPPPLLQDETTTVNTRTATGKAINLIEI
jgi:hypothetical protein